MKIVQINATCGIGSTGKICLEVSKLLSAKGIENYILYSLGKSDYPFAIKYCNEPIRKLQSLYEKITGLYGFGASITTKRLLKELDRIKPDIVHIHNIHSHDCDYGILGDYLKKHNIKVYWTFHDCWAFTAYCTHFDMAGCDKWKTECSNCILHKSYSLFFDRSKKLYNLKKNAIQGLNLTVITPSKWLGRLSSESFLKGCDIKLINNGINLDIFRLTHSDVRKKYGCEDKFVILGVANIWTKHKGIEYFLKLANELDNQKYQIILVGTNDDVDKQLPADVVSIHRTNNQKQLAEIYTAADLFVMPTLEENFPTVNIEALACGTPVLTFDTGGSAEIIDETCGKSVPRGDYDALKKEIERISTDRPYNSDSCVARAANYNCKRRFEEYVNLYRYETK